MLWITLFFACFLSTITLFYLLFRVFKTCSVKWNNCFGIGLFAAGITSTLTAPLAAAFASSGILGWGEDMKQTRFKIFWIIVLAFGIFATCTLGASPTQIILFAQAANALLLPIT